MTQDRALDVLKTGANIFLTGEPGSGKTYVLNQYIAWLEHMGVSVAVTASTGIAATHVGGMTIHSWSGIGARDGLTQYDLDHIATNEKIVKRVKKARVLVIDEISMLDGRVLDGIEAIMRTIRQSGDAFGGLQVILVGDFFQLPPIAGRGEMARFAFESTAWERAKFLTCYLTEQHRQEDELLLGLLSAIRRNDVDESHYTLLGEQTEIGYTDIEPTRLFTHNSDVDALNADRLNLLDTEKSTYKMEVTVAKNKVLVEALKKSCLSPDVLVLKREAMVMCTKNNFEAGYVNGTLGRVVDFDSEDGFPIIETPDERTIKIAEISQVPLRLAWAITVHKSQGMSLDAAEIDLRNAFTYGQGYVALSRVRTLTGMKILGLNPQALLVDPRVVLRDQHFREESDDVDVTFDAMDDEEILSHHKTFITGVGGTWKDGVVNMSERPKAERIKKESTYALTKELVLRRLDAGQIAKERNMALSTIWAHIEKLVQDNEIGREHLHALIPSRIQWEDVYGELSEAFKREGTEKLKPVYEALGERYDYDTIRLGRIFYTLK
jgi:ATP-dependent DNA helicase PIF1